MLGLLAAVRGRERHTLLDRVIRGRTWIALIAFALIGIVALQLGLLKLNAGIGRSLERQGSLQRENAALKIENSELAAGERVEAKAARLGMQLVPVGALKALTIHPGADAARAASALTSSSAATTTTTSTTSSAAAEAGASTSATTASATAEQAAASTSTATAEHSATEAGASETGEAPPSTVAAAPAPAEAAATSTGAAPAPSETQAQASSTSATTPATSEAVAGGGTQAGPAG